MCGVQGASRFRLLLLRIVILMSSQNLIEVQRLLRISRLAEVLEQSLDLGLCPSLDLVVNMPIAIVLFILLLKLDM